MRPRADVEAPARLIAAVVGASATDVIEEGIAGLATAVEECSEGRHGSMLG